MSEMLNARHAVYVGSFDPPTLGHRDIISRGAGLFRHVTVGVGINPDKSPLFSSGERLNLLREIVAPLENVAVEWFEGRAVDFVRQCGASVMLRGMRTLTDIESEFTLTLANRSLAPDIETVFLMAEAQHQAIASKLVKEIARLGGNVTKFVTPDVDQMLRTKLAASRAAAE